MTVSQVALPAVRLCLTTLAWLIQNTVVVDACEYQHMPGTVHKLYTLFPRGNKTPYYEIPVAIITCSSLLKHENTVEEEDVTAHT